MEVYDPDWRKRLPPTIVKTRMTLPADQFNGLHRRELESLLAQKAIKHRVTMFDGWPSAGFLLMEYEATKEGSVAISEALRNWAE